MKIVQDLGEDVLPEPTTAEEIKKAESEERMVDKVAPPLSESSAPETAAPKQDGETEHKVTTAERKPMKIPESVHFKITPENLKDYVGPPVYYKDRMYVKAPPHGVSTGLGYLGNGSGAVMPIEATVSRHLLYGRFA